MRIFAGMAILGLALLAACSSGLSANVQAPSLGSLQKISYPEGVETVHLTPTENRLRLVEFWATW